MAQTKTKNFYGWKIVVCCFLISMFAMGIISNTISFYMKPVCETLGCSYVQFSFINVVSCITSMLAAILLAPKIEGGNVRMIMLVSAAAPGWGSDCRAWLHISGTFMYYSVSPIWESGD